LEAQDGDGREHDRFQVEHQPFGAPQGGAADAPDAVRPLMSMNSGQAADAVHKAQVQELADVGGLEG
jgi:hypothetical protein